jgi:hypothetical protein
MNQKKLNLINEILKDDFYFCNLEGSLKNDELVLWSQTDKYANFIHSVGLRNQIKRFPANMSLIKDDGACILSIKLSNDEVNEVVNILKIQQADWSDDRDFRSETEKHLDDLVYKIESFASGIKHLKRINADRLGDLSFEEAIDKLIPALKLVKQANEKLM